MPRQYAQIITAIWRNDDFTALSHDEQWMYLLLNTQADISAAGVLTLAITRWAGRSPTMDAGKISRLLDRLATRRFLIIDRDTDELLIRSFIRWDKGYANPKRQPAIRDAVDAVESKTILTALAAELDRVAMPIAYRGRALDVTQVTSSSGRVERASETASPQVDSLSIGYRDGNDGLSDIDGSSERRVPLTPNPQPLTTSTPLVNAARRPGGQPDLFGEPASAVALREAPMARTSRESQFAEFWQVYPRRVGKQGARKAWDTKVRAGADPALITAGAKAFADNRRDWATPIDKIPHPSTWLNAGRWEDELPPPPAKVTTGGFDARAAEFDVMSDRLRARQTAADSAAALIRPARPELTAGGNP